MSDYLIEKYLGTRMQLQNEFDKLRKIGKSIGQAKLQIEKDYKVNITVRNDGTIVNIK